MKEQRNIFHKKGCEKTARIAILTQTKHFETKSVTRDKEGHYIITKRKIQQEVITIVNIYAPNMGALKYLKQLIIKMKEGTDSNTVIVVDFNTLLTLMHRSSKEKFNKKTVALNDTPDQMDLKDVFRTFHP